MQILITTLKCAEGDTKMEVFADTSFVAVPDFVNLIREIILRDNIPRQVAVHLSVKLKCYARS